MTVGPPHIYVKEGKKRGISEEIIKNALIISNISQKYGIPSILTLKHLAHLTNTEYRYLRQIVERKRDPYHVFQISKRNGGKRIICVPDLTLMIVQKWLFKNVLSKIKPHYRSFAYSPGSSILLCAQEHCGCDWLIKIDIRRFFESITEIKVYELFLSIGYQSLIAFELARICTRLSIPTIKKSTKWICNLSKDYQISSYQSRYLGHVPQGAPTSPMIANLVSRILDEKIHEVADNEGFVYTRYADDLMFSSINANCNRKKATNFIRRIYHILRKNKYEPHTAKTVIAPPGSRKLVLGLLVDREKPRLTKNFKNNLKRHIWGVNRFGLINHLRYRNFQSIWGFKRHIEGLIAYAMMVEPNFANPLVKSFHESVQKSGFQQPD